MAPEEFKSRLQDLELKTSSGHYDFANYGPRKRTYWPIPILALWGLHDWVILCSLADYA